MAEKKSPAPPFVPSPDRSAELPLNDAHLRLEEAVHKLTPPRIRNACRNALNHLRKAWVLHPVDAEMSLFCAITAEEEAATAVIRALRLRAYPNAERLKERQHPHKMSIWAFVTAVADKMAEKNIPMPSMGLRIDGDPRIELSIDLAGQAGLDWPLWGTPDEPFNFSMWSDRTGPFKPHDFYEELATLAAGKGAHNIEAHIAAEANLRNRILYASDQGIPSVSFADSLIIGRRQRVTVMLVLTIAILQSEKHQLFLVQCLDALLRAVQRFEGDALEIPHLDKASEHLELAEQADGTMKLSHVRPVTGYGFRYTIPPERWPPKQVL
jgi:hypothetical protein